MLMLASAMVVNNLYKRFPLYWWTPVDLSGMRKGPDVVSVRDAEKADEARTDSASTIGGASDATLAGNAVGRTEKESSVGEGEVHVSRPGGEQFDTTEQERVRNIHEDPELKIQIEVDRIVVPDWMSLSQWEIEALEGFQTRLRESVGSRSGLES